MDIVQINIRKLDATLLLVLVELVRHRRTTVVARRLGLSQSAVSHALKRLRLLFDEPLFLRRADGLTPTARALDLAPRAEAVLVQMGGLLAPAAFDPHTATHGFTLASNDLFALLVGAPLTVDIAARAPKVSLTAQFRVGDAAFAGLTGGDTDLAIGRFYRTPADIIALPLFEETFVTVARADHPHLCDGLDLARFVALDHVLVSFVGGAAGLVDTELAALGLTRRVLASVPLFGAALASVALGDAIATVPARLARRLARPFGLAIHPTPLSLPAFPVSLMRAKRRAGDPALDWLESRIVAITAALDT